MVRHLARKDPWAHWLLLVLGLLVLAATLTLDGYANYGGGGSGRPVTDRPVRPAAGAGPVVLPGQGRLATRSMPTRTMALTFDDGPDPEWTPRILDVLRRYHAHVTFFVVGAQVNRHPELARRILAEGHELGSHTFTHADLATIPAWRADLELTMTSNAIAGATGRTAPLFRPPFSSTISGLTRRDQASLAVAASAGQINVLADRDTDDWRRPGVDAIVAAATPDRGAGAVVLMHDGGGDRSQTVAALGRLLSTLTERGYRFTTVSEGLGRPSSNKPAGLESRLRGDALRAVQFGGHRVRQALQILLVSTLALAAVRLAAQIYFAFKHVRMTRRRRREARPVTAPVSVIVPAYNEALNIAATVRSLVDSDHPMLEIIVVDDGSSDGTADIVERLGLPNVRVIRQANAGKPAALNTGIHAARFDLLVLIDGDTVFQPDTISRLISGFADPEVGAISGNTKIANRERLLGAWQHLEYVVGFNFDRRMQDVLGCIGTIPGAIGAFRRTVLMDVGGVPTDTLAEDTDLTMRILRAGWEVRYEDRAVAWTEAPSTLRQLWRQRYRWSYGTMQAMWKHRRAPIEAGPGGKLGRRGLPYLTVFQILLPLAAPAADVYAVYAFFFSPFPQVAAAWVALLVLQTLVTALALRLDGERRYRALWSIPFQQVVYRQMMYLVVLQSVVTALLGTRLRWHRIARTGAAAALVRRGAPGAGCPGTFNSVPHELGPPPPYAGRATSSPRNRP